MANNLKKEIESYIIINRDSFKKYLSQTDLLNDEGKVNLESVSQIVDNEIKNMHKSLDALEYEQLSNQIKKAYQSKQFSEILRLQFMLNLFTKSKPSMAVARLTVIESLFTAYCKILANALW